MRRRCFAGALGLALLGLAACGPGGEVTAASPEASPAAFVAAFVSQRPADTTDEQGPYRVQVLQLSGPAAFGGRLAYRVELC